MEFVTPYNGKTKKVTQDFYEQSLTDQSCKDECDIGFIIENFVRTGQMPSQPQMNYTDCTTVQSFEEASMLVAQCKTDFELLPAVERDKFKTVQGWLEYCSNSENLKDCIEKGYISKESVDKDTLNKIYNKNDLDTQKVVKNDEVSSSNQTNEENTTVKKDS